MHSQLAWSVLKDYLESQGVQEVVGSKGATREAFKNGLLADGEVWMDMIKSRNQTSHTYNEKTANEITEAILTRSCAQFSQFQARFSRLQEALPLHLTNANDRISPRSCPSAVLAMFSLAADGLKDT